MSSKDWSPKLSITSVRLLSKVCYCTLSLKNPKVRLIVQCYMTTKNYLDGISTVECILHDTAGIYDDVLASSTCLHMGLMLI